MILVVGSTKIFRYDRLSIEEVPDYCVYASAMRWLMRLGPKKLAVAGPRTIKPCTVNPCRARPKASEAGAETPLKRPRYYHPGDVLKG